MFPEYTSEAPTILDTPALVQEEPYVETFPAAESKSVEDMILWSEGNNNSNRVYDDNGIPLPYGFKSIEEYNIFVNKLKSGLPDGSQVIFQGSSVTGLGHSSGLPFDVGRTSDFDIAIVSEDLYILALENNFREKTQPNRIGPMNERQLSLLGLDILAESLSEISGREVHFMLFESTSEAYKRPSLPAY